MLEDYTPATDSYSADQVPLFMDPKVSIQILLRARGLSSNN